MELHETNYYIVACTLVHALLNIILYFTGGKTSNKNLKFEFNMLQIMLMLTGNFVSIKAISKIG